MTIIVAKFVVASIIGLAFGCVSLKGGSENPLIPVWVCAVFLSFFALMAGALTFVFGEQLPWASFTLTEWLFIVMDIGCLLGGFATAIFETR
ncbi:MAG: hypothetical protein C0469_00105 [Cyanobacteria bacterium DS2.3.42]|nr:hypothetical protein [Cyanobacteria bacterium DS2.3.42]